MLQQTGNTTLITRKTLCPILQKVKLELSASCDIGLFETFGLAVMPLTGEVVIGGKATSKECWVLHIFALVGRQLQKVRELKASCQHGKFRNFLGILSRGRELLALACEECQDVKLVDVMSGEVSVGYKTELGDPILVYAGEAGKMWLSGSWGGELIELKVSSSRLAATGRMVRVRWEECFSMCYLPPPVCAVVGTKWCGDSCMCVSCKTGEKNWELEGVVDGEKIGVYGMAFCPKLQILLLADRDSSRILVLDPCCGSHLQTCHVPVELGVLCELSLHNDQLFMRTYHPIEGSYKLSCFTLSSTPQLQQTATK